MLHFIYAYSEHTPRNGHTTKSVKIYQIKKNTPVFVASGSDQFVGELQLVLQIMESAKLLPRKAFVKNANTGSNNMCTAWQLREAGIADVVRI